MASTGAFIAADKEIIIDFLKERNMRSQMFAKSLHSLCWLKVHLSV